MFDIGFWELILIAIMGLVILGPERLPVAIRTVRGWISEARKFSDSVKSEITEELRVHELHTNLKKAEQSNLQNLSPEVAESLKSLKEAAESVTEPFKKLDTQTMDTTKSSSHNVPPQDKYKAIDDSLNMNSDVVTESMADDSHNIPAPVDKESDKSQS